MEIELNESGSDEIKRTNIEAQVNLEYNYDSDASDEITTSNKSNEQTFVISNKSDMESYHC